VESARLIFNFTSVQFYEILVVLTAIFLARRRIWYDSTLLVGLENLLVFVPFILISNAALIDSNMALEMCLAGAAVAVVRFGGLKRHFTQLNLPVWLLGIGSVLLALNVALPLIYRHFGETKIGVHIDSGPAYVMNECTWLLILPAVLGLVNFLPRARAAGNLPPQHRWLPLGMFTLWIVVTCAHLYGLDFIYQFDLRGELLAPAAWVLVWTIFRRAPAKLLWHKYALTLQPLCVPLLSTSPGGRETFLILAALNLAGYGTVSLQDRSNRLARHLVVAAALLLVAGLPAGWLPAIATGSAQVPALGPGLAQIKCVAAGLMAYVILWTALRRSPQSALIGSIFFSAALMWVFRHHPGAGHWAIQSGFVFLLLHSLRWKDGEHPAGNLVRLTAGLTWVIQSVVWMNADTGRFWMPFIPGAIVLGTCFACQLYRFEWEKTAVPVAAFLVMLSGPSCGIVEGVRLAPQACSRSPAAFCSSAAEPWPRLRGTTGINPKTGSDQTSSALRTGNPDLATRGINFSSDCIRAYLCDNNFVMRNPIIAALDVPTAEQALQLAEQIAPAVGMFKIGSELFTAAGPDIVKKVRATGASVFLDLKFHDIPNTVTKAVTAAVQLDVQMLTVHTSGGTEMLKAAEKAAEETAWKLGRIPPLVLGVTVLTSLDVATLREIGLDVNVEYQVRRLATMANKAGLRGLVCSPQEVVKLRQFLPPAMQLITPRHPHRRGKGR